MQHENRRRSESGGAHRYRAGGYGALFDAAIDPFDEHTIAARCDMGSIYVSHNDGESWYRHNINGTVLTMRLDPTTEGVIWAGGSGVYKSTDHGRTFNIVYPSPESITLQGNNLENGNYWIFSDEDYEASYQVWGLAINRKSGGKNVFAAQRVLVYNGRPGKIVIHSTDDGLHFKKFAELAGDDYSYNFKLDYDESKDRLVVVTKDKIYEFDKNGNIADYVDISVFVHHGSDNTLAFYSYYNVKTNKNTFVFSVNKKGEHSATACYMTNDIMDKSSYRDLVPALVAKPLKSISSSTSAQKEGYASYEYVEWIDGVPTRSYFDWTICNVSVLNEDVIYLYHEAETPLVNGYVRRTLAYLKYDGTDYKWVYGFPYKATNKEENTSWQDGEAIASVSRPHRKTPTQWSPRR